MSGTVSSMGAAALAAVLAVAGAGDPPSPLRAVAPDAPLPFPTAAFAPDGTLFVVWVDGPHVYVGRSRDLGKTFAETMPVTREAEPIDANGEARPKIAISAKGEVYVSYTRKGKQPFTGDIRFARRLADGGFSPPVTINDDGLATGHRFDTLSVSPSGEVHLVWIDKRDVEKAKDGRRDYAGAALYETVSVDGGRTFAANRKVKDEVCECCRIALAWDGDVAVLFWRDIVGGHVRDHAMARLAGKEAVVERVTDDGWKIDGCPHHGPALAISADGTRHLAWFTGEGVRGSGLFYRRSTDGGRTFSEPMPLGGRGAGHPVVRAEGKDVWLAWKEVGEESTTIQSMRSADGGLTWSRPREVLRAKGASDHPLLVARGGQTFVSWFASEAGYRLVALD